MITMDRSDDHHILDWQYVNGEENLTLTTKLTDMTGGSFLNHGSAAVVTVVFLTERRMETDGHITAIYNVSDGRLTSDPADIGGLMWHIEKQQKERCFKWRVVCNKSNDKTSLWECDASGTVTIGETRKAPCGPVEISTLPREGQVVVEASFKTKIRSIDLSSITNETIKSLQDAACIDVEGTKLWLSKKDLILHSHYFKTMFASDYPESSGVCTLTNVKLSEFMHFIGILYNFRSHINDQTAPYLIYLGDYFQSDLVLRRCRDYLECREVPILNGANLATSYEIIRIGDRHGWALVVNRAIEKTKTKHLKEMYSKTGFKELSEHTRDLITQRLLLFLGD
ncbi:hypothetical protein QR680_008005 [Steinernema hermaphroditum]|uniref:BTB domain-containing protein n=1 Tax=Steinernema hermaphroditum TaxID=289476 RepID=A0AA39IEY7_9BILA|nr:hypothetical protein QR680_008005 [Steinernema hermaphroditum]